MTVLDASAVLALLQREPGASEVAAALPDARMSAVNLAEVIGKLVDLGMPGAAIVEVFDGLDLAIVPFDAAAAFGTAELRRTAGGRRLSLGDRACLHLASTDGEPVLTADRAWTAFSVGVEVRQIR